MKLFNSMTMKKEDFVAKVRLAITKQIERGKEIG